MFGLLIISKAIINLILQTRFIKDLNVNFYHQNLY